MWVFKQNRKSTLYDLINTDRNNSNILNPDDITHNELNEAMKNLKNHRYDKGGTHLSEFPFRIYWWTLKNPKNQTFEKMKKIAGGIIIL